MPNSSSFLLLDKPTNKQDKPPNEQDKPPIDVSGGWFAPRPGSLYTGNPETEQEKAWILDYMLRNKRAPNLDELSQWKSTQDTSRFTYLPESTMGRLGWGGLTWEDYRKSGQWDAYGPFAGDLKPENTITWTDEWGNPSYSSVNARSMLGMGRYMEPPGGIPVQHQNLFGTQGYREIPAGIPATEGIYSQKKQDYWTQPTPEEILKEPSYEQYKAQLSDYISGRVRDDYETVKGVGAEISSLGKKLNIYDDTELQKAVEEYNNIKEELSNNPVPMNKSRATPEQLRMAKRLSELDELPTLIELLKKQGTLMSSGKAEQIMSEAESMIGLGLPFEELPLYGDIQGMRGENTMAFYQSHVDRLKDEWMAGQPQPVEPAPSTTTETDNWGNYVSFIESLNVSPSSVSFMYDNYQMYLSRWLQDGQAVDFITWLKSYIGGK